MSSQDKVDIFIVAHLMGYWCKTLIFRDWWLTTVISIMFEFLEYSLEHQLNNFSECWWDHWILDVIICNGGGTILGIYTLRSAPSQTYYGHRIKVSHRQISAAGKLLFCFLEGKTNSSILQFSSISSPSEVFTLFIVGKSVFASGNRFFEAQLSEF